MSGVFYQPDQATLLKGDLVGFDTGLFGVLTVTWAVLGIDGKTKYRRSKFSILGADTAALLAGCQALVKAIDARSIGEPVKVDLKLTHYLPTEALESEPANPRSGVIGFRNAIDNRITSTGAIWWIRPDDQIEEIIAAAETALEAAGCVFAAAKQSDARNNYVQYPCTDQAFARYMRRNELTAGEVTPDNPGDDVGDED